VQLQKLGLVTIQYSSLIIGKSQRLLISHDSRVDLTHEMIFRLIPMYGSRGAPSPKAGSDPGRMQLLPLSQVGVWVGARSVIILSFFGFHVLCVDTTKGAWLDDEPKLTQRLPHKAKRKTPSRRWVKLHTEVHVSHFHGVLKVPIDGNHEVEAVNRNPRCGVESLVVRHLPACACSVV